MARPKKRKWDSKASAKDGENFGMVYESMLKSKAYKELNPGAKAVYMMCRVHAQTKECKASLYNHGKEYERLYDEHDFVFPPKQLQEYNCSRQNFFKMKEQLIAKGFIEIKECNKARQDVNVYSFSDKWKTYK